MPRRKSYCPARPIPDCPSCARAGGVFDFSCRACLVRHLAGVLADRRDQVLERIEEDHGVMAAHALREDVQAFRVGRFKV